MALQKRRTKFFEEVSAERVGAVAQAAAAAGERAVGVHSGATIRQCLEAGLLDEIHLDLVPVLLGSGIPLFDQARDAPVVLGDPTVVAGVGVTHLRYPVQKNTRP